MKHLKLYEEFESDYFSTYYEEISADQYNSWRESWIQGGMYLVMNSDGKSKGFYQKIEDLCKSIIGNVTFSSEFERMEDGEDVLKIVICYCEDTKHVVLIRPFDDDGAIGFMVSIFGRDASPVDYTKAMGHFICEESEARPFEGLEQLLEDKVKEGLFTKVPKTPKAYKNEPKLTDADFSERGVDNTQKAQFYKENGRVVRDLPREEALVVLDEWCSRNNIQSMKHLFKFESFEDIFNDQLEDITYSEYKKEFSNYQPFSDKELQKLSEYCNKMEFKILSMPIKKSPVVKKGKLDRFKDYISSGFLSKKFVVEDSSKFEFEIPYDSSGVDKWKGENMHRIVLNHLDIWDDTNYARFSLFKNTSDYWYVNFSVSFIGRSFRSDVYYRFDEIKTLFKFVESITSK